MKRLLLPMSLLLNSILCLYIFICILGTKQKQNAVITQNVSVTKKTKKIAVLQPLTHPSLDEICRGFIETLKVQKHLHCKFKVYNANGNRSLMRSQLEEIIRGDYDLLYTIGAHTTQMAKEVTAKKRVELPIVFGAVANPVDLKLVNNISSSGNNLTGAAATTNYPYQIDLLCSIRSNIKNVLIVYDPTQSSGLQKDKQVVENLLRGKNVSVRSLEVYKTNEVFDKLAGIVHQYDIVFIFKDNTVVPAVDGLVKLCSRHGVTLCTTDLDSVDKGAVLGFGVHEFCFGSDAAICALDILIKGKKPSEVPIKITDNYRLRLNTKFMEQQNVVVDKKMLQLMRAIEVT